jgi:2-polyprenyl-6-methoxyphenol hydroxylase-like FAD-dependent oxidoreductase
MTMECVIAGGGIGGLVTALMLHARGIPVTLYEQSQVLRPLGVGINLLPHAVRELSELGLQDALAAIAIETSSLSYLNHLGQTIWSEPRGTAAGYRWPQFSVHRGDLQMLLLREATRRLGGERIQTGHSLRSSRTEDDAAVLCFTTVAGSERTVRATVAVAADGIHSAQRRQMYPHEGPARFSQRMLWRGVTEAAPFLDGRSMFMAGWQEQKFVAYPISEPHRRAGRSLVNWIAELSVPGQTPVREDWNKRVHAGVFGDHFAGWRFSWVDIPALISEAEFIYEFPMVDRDPLPSWVAGRVALLGDAAHPMYPIGSNGASQAILDARCLADCLVRFPDSAYALREYEAERLPRTAGIVLRNRLNGPEQVMQLAHERAPRGFDDIETVVPRAELEEIALRYKRIAGFDPATVNSG